MVPEALMRPWTVAPVSVVLYLCIRRSTSKYFLQLNAVTFLSNKHHPHVLIFFSLCKVTMPDHFQNFVLVYLHSCGVRGLHLAVPFPLDSF